MTTISIDNHRKCHDINYLVLLLYKESHAILALYRADGDSEPNVPWPCKLPWPGPAAKQAVVAAVALGGVPLAAAGLGAGERLLMAAGELVRAGGHEGGIGVGVVDADAAEVLVDSTEMDA